TGSPGHRHRPNLLPHPQSSQPGRNPPMIPRYQRILFWILIGGIALMAAFLLHGCRQAHKRLTAFNDATPMPAPTPASTEDVTLYPASDAYRSTTAPSSQDTPPKDSSIRARILLDHLI